MNDAKGQAGGRVQVAAEPSGDSVFNDFSGAGRFTSESMGVATMALARRSPPARPAVPAVMRRFLPSQRAKVTAAQAGGPSGGLVKMSGNNCTTRRGGGCKEEEEEGEGGRGGGAPASCG